MKALLLLSVLISLSSPALARIGETREQCEARYGKPVEVHDKLQATVHHKSGLKIGCVYHEGKCEYISFSHLEKTADGVQLPLTEDEQKILLESSSQGKPWTLLKEPSDSIYTNWECGELHARYTVGSLIRVLTIATNASLERATAEREAEEAAKKKGKLEDF